MWTKSSALHGAVLLALLSLGFGQTPGAEQGEMTGAQSELAEMAAERSEMAGAQGEMTGGQGSMTQNQGQLPGGQGQVTGGTGAQQEIEPPEIGEYVSQPGTGTGSQLGAGSGARAGDRAGTGAGAGSEAGAGSRAGAVTVAGAGAGTAGALQEIEPPEIGEYVSKTRAEAGTGAGAVTGTGGRVGSGAGAGSSTGAGTAAAAGTAGSQYEVEPPEIGEYGAGRHVGTGAGTVAETGTAGTSSGQGQQNMGSAAATQAIYKAENTNLGLQRNQGTRRTNIESVNTNKNAYANVKSNTNTYGTTNVNTNANTNANSNTNIYGTTNVNTNANTNANSNTNIYGTTNVNTNANTNANSNTNIYGTTNVNTNANTNANSNTNPYGTSNPKTNYYNNVNSNTNPYGTTNPNTNANTNANSNVNPYGTTNLNTNANTNANSNTNPYGTSNSNTNANANVNINPYGTSNSNTNANANVNSNIYGTTNLNTNPNTSANSNTNPYGTSNPNTNANLKTYNGHTKPANPIEYEPPEYPTGSQAGMTAGSQRTQTNPNYEYEPPEQMSINPLYMKAAGRSYQPSAPSQFNTFGYANQYNQNTGRSGSRNIYTQTVMSNIQTQKANQYARSRQHTAQKPSTSSYIGTNQETQQKQVTSAGQIAGDVYAQSQILHQQAATRLSHPGSKNTGTSSVSSSLYPILGQLTKRDQNPAIAGMNPAGLAVLNQLFQRFKQIASTNNYDYNKVRAAISKQNSGINIPFRAAQAVQTTSQQATGVNYNPTTTNTKSGYSVGSQTAAGNLNTQTTSGKYPVYQSNSQTQVVDLIGHLPGGQSQTQTYEQKGSQTGASAYDPTKASPLSGGSQTISVGQTSGSLTGQTPGTTQIQEQKSITTQGHSTRGIQIQSQTSGTTQVQGKKENSQGQGQINGAYSAQSTSNQTPLTGATVSIGSYKPSIQSNSLQMTLSSPLQYPSPQGQSVQLGGSAEYQTDPVMTNLQANVGRMIALKMQELARRQYQQQYGIKPVV